MGGLWRSLAVRLFTAQVLVVLAGAVTLTVVAATAGPALFRTHLRQATHSVDAQTARHVEQAYRLANTLSLGLAALAALAAALSVSAYLAHRLGRTVATLAGAAVRVADGHYGTRAAAPGLGEEFDALTAAFNAMAARLESVEATRRQLLADLGHEMRTPVATIEGYLDAAEDGISVADEDTLSVLRAQTSRLRRLAEDLSAVSRAEEHLELDRRSVAVADLVAAAVAGAQGRYTAKGVHLRPRLEPDLPAVEADPQRIGQLMGNLLDNALRHTPPGGEVTLTARRHTGGVRLVVADTGSGIAAEHLPHLFERFYRVDAARDRDHGGSGIGLAIAQAIATAHGGLITAESPGPGGGAVFILTLPAG